MNVLLDTHILIYLLRFPSNLLPKELEYIENTNINLYFSAVSIWEISIKYNLGRLEFLNGSTKDFRNWCIESGWKLKNIEIDEVSSFYELKSIESHKDPFNRLLVWQCIKNDFKLISRDKKLEQYKEFGLKIID